MNYYSSSRRYDLRIYFTDSPHPVDVEEVIHLQTEGALLRVTTADGKTQWWPLCQVFNIGEVSR